MKNTLLMTLMFGTALMLTGCGQQSQPIIDQIDDTLMTGTMDSGSVDTTVTTPVTDMPVNNTDNTQANGNTNTSATDITTNTSTTDIPSVKSYTMADVTAHGSETSCWTAIDGNVYDISAFFGKHPGGDRNILRICGIDGTAAFEGQHGGQARPEKTLAGFMIGTLAK